MTGKSKAPQAALFLLLLLSFALNAGAAPRVKSKLAKKPKATQTKCSRTTDANIVNEATNGLKNDKYTVAMARTNEPHSASSQFFINA